METSNIEVQKDDHMEYARDVAWNIVTIIDGRLRGYCAADVWDDVTRKIMMDEIAEYLHERVLR